MTAAAPDRYRGNWRELAQVAEWLRDQRAGRYGEMVAKGQLDEQAAYRDDAARAALAIDWLAVVDDVEPVYELGCVPEWKAAALEQALEGLAHRIGALTDDDPARAAMIDRRDAVACMLAYERGPYPRPQFWPMLRRLRDIG